MSMTARTPLVKDIPKTSGGANALTALIVMLNAMVRDNTEWRFQET